MSSNAAGFRALDEMIASIRAIPGLGAREAPGIARDVYASLQQTASAGQSPYGEAWAPGKKSGARVMVDAAKAITVQAIGSTIRIILSGPEVFHHFGASGKPPRPVIPTGILPLSLGNAIRLGIVKGWDRTVASRKNYTASGHRVRS